jgi:hypothetical protein
VSWVLSDLLCRAAPGSIHLPLLNEGQVPGSRACGGKTTLAHVTSPIRVNRFRPWCLALTRNGARLAGPKRRLPDEMEKPPSPPQGLDRQSNGHNRATANRELLESLEGSWC